MTRMGSAWRETSWRQTPALWNLAISRGAQLHWDEDHPTSVAPCTKCWICRDCQCQASGAKNSSIVLCFLAEFSVFLSFTLSYMEYHGISGIDEHSTNCSAYDQSRRCTHYSEFFHIPFAISRLVLLLDSLCIFV